MKWKKYYLSRHLPVKKNWKHNQHLTLYCWTNYKRIYLKRLSFMYKCVIVNKKKNKKY